MGKWSEPVPYGNTRFEIQGDNRRVAVVDTIEHARLIAAAPELLAALEEAQDYLEDIADNASTFTFAANERIARAGMRKIRAAIAQAKGGG